MKGFLKTIGFTGLYLLAGGIIYVLCMLLFAWMANWWWFFIIAVGIGGVSALIGLGQIAGVFIAPILNNWLGKILLIAASIYLLYFSIHAVWTTDFLSSDAKEITVRIIGTIVFASTYLPGVFAALFFKK
jgi:hypothetical protein